MGTAQLLPLRLWFDLRRHEKSKSRRLPRCLVLFFYRPPAKRVTHKLPSKPRHPRRHLIKARGPLITQPDEASGVDTWRGENKRGSCDSAKIENLWRRLVA